jgi:hypothetical protein
MARFGRKCFNAKEKGREARRFQYRVRHRSIPRDKVQDHGRGPMEAWQTVEYII